jgi:GAF domain-containing protein/HAMP domain-containing protein
MRFWRKSLVIRLVIYFLFLSVITLGIVGAITFFRARNTFEESVFEQLNAVATLKETELNRWVEDQRLNILFIARAPEVRSSAEALLVERETDLDPQAARAALREYLLIAVAGRRELTELFILDEEGVVILSTSEAQEGEIYSGESFFTRGLLGTYVQNVYPSPETGEPIMTIATPLIDPLGGRAGVLAAHLNVDRMERIVLEEVGLGRTGETYLVDRSHSFVSESFFSRDEFPEGVHTAGIDAALEGNDGQGLYLNYEGVPVIGVYRWIDDQELALLAELHQDEAFAPARRLASSILTTGLVSATLLAIGIVIFARRIARPIQTITGAATQVAAGDLSLTVPVLAEDEVGTLARAFNRMIEQLRDVYAGLEEEVASRTQDLQRRSAYLQAAAEVGRAASSILEPESLIRQVVDLIRDRFDLYYVGLFLLDESGEWAVLRAGTGEAGQAMLARGHRIRFGQGMIGWSVAHGEARVALEAEEDAVRLATPELPETRSEAAVPMRSRGRVVGALTVQSTQPAAFDEDILVSLEAMADQVAVALDNAYLFTMSQAALEAERRAYGELSRKAWRERLGPLAGTGYQANNVGLFRLDPAGPETWAEEARRAWRTGKTVKGGGEEDVEEHPLAIPVRVRGETLGVISTSRSGEAWTEEEIAQLEMLVDQLGMALENARLFEEARRRAERERIITDITSRVRAATDVEGILRTAIQELGQALQASGGLIHLQLEDGEDGDGAKRYA